MKSLSIYAFAFLSMLVFASYGHAGQYDVEISGEVKFTNGDVKRFSGINTACSIVSRKKTINVTYDNERIKLGTDEVKSIRLNDYFVTISNKYYDCLSYKALLTMRDGREFDVVLSGMRMSLIKKNPINGKKSEQKYSLLGMGKYTNCNCGSIDDDALAINYIEFD